MTRARLARRAATDRRVGGYDRRRGTPRATRRYLDPTFRTSPGRGRLPGADPTSAVRRAAPDHPASPMRLFRLAVAGSAALLGASCVRHRPSLPRPGDAATLEVRNNYLASIDVYVQRENGGAEFRIGQVFANRTESFPLDPQVIGGSSNVAFIAVPVATQSRPALGRAVSSPLVLRAGDLVRFNVTTDLRSSTAFLVR